ncbi:MAG: AAA family ATPase, partial [Desulfobacterales bacterium]
EHTEALAILRYGVLENKGLLLLTGDIGTGKTTLVSALVDRLDTDRVVTARLPDPGLTRREFFYLVSRGFGITGQVHDKETFTDAFGNFLDQISSRNKKALLIIDEAQVANDRVLEEIRLLSNLEYRHVKPLNIFLVGQSEFNQQLLEPANRAIKERIAVNYSLEPLTEAETAAYIAHRLQVAGTRKKIFTDDAVHEIQAFSKGAPRRINILCDLALVRGYAENARVLDRRVIVDCERRIIIDGPTIELLPDSDRPPATMPRPEVAAAGIGEAVRPVTGSVGRIRRYAILALVIFLPAIFILYALWSSGLIIKHVPSGPASSGAGPSPGMSPAPAGTTSGKAATAPLDRRTGDLNSRLPEPAPEGTPAAGKLTSTGQKESGGRPAATPQPTQRIALPAPSPPNPEKNLPVASDTPAAVNRNSPPLSTATMPGAENSALSPSPTENLDPADIINWLMLEKKKAKPSSAR